MTANIEKYRGIDIWFDTELESFQCDIDDSRSIKKSYPALKKFIDEYIKENETFKLIHIELNPNGYSGGVNLIKVVGIRKDGRFIGETKNGSKVQISDYILDSYILKESKNEHLINELNNVKLERDKVMKSFSEKIDLIKSKLSITTLKDYKRQLGL